MTQGKGKGKGGGKSFGDALQVPFWIWCLEGIGNETEMLTKLEAKKNPSLWILHFGM